VTMDADLQHPPALLPQMLAAWSDGAKVVSTVRTDAGTISPFKKATSRLYYGLLGLVSGESFAPSVAPGMSDFRLLDQAVVRELLLALGRIGSPDAVQALIKWAQPTGRFFGRKPSELRVAAVEALRLAASPPALGTLEGLSDDSDRAVREAARQAVTELKRKSRR